VAETEHSPVRRPPFSLAEKRRIHVVGAGGAGMSAIALVLAQMGHSVSGSDLRDSRTLTRIALTGVTTNVGHRAEHVDAGIDAVVISTAVGRRNVEVRRAEELGIPVLRRADMLAAITAQKRGIAVAGTHGKTTTSSMLTLVLRAAGMRPCFLVGGELNEVGTNAGWDHGEWLVVEADESDGTFLELPAEAAIVTSIEPDHLEHYGTFDKLVASFDEFVRAAAGPTVVCVDDEHSAALAARHPSVVTYGFGDAHYRITGFRAHDVGSSFELRRGGETGETVAQLALPVPGRHNAANAAAAATLAAELGVDAGATQEALAGFGGVARRFQFRGTRDGVTFVDDYAHLPSEVRAAISAARDGAWTRVLVVFQPHRYSRTESLWRDFATAFDGADHLVVTDVYPAGESPRVGVTGRLVVDAVKDARPDLPVEYAPTRAMLRDLAQRLASAGDLVLTLGAGDLTTMPDEWLRSAS
jgi:UDP-N-acetylmuramate--alanine ligase